MTYLMPTLFTVIFLVAVTRRFLFKMPENFYPFQ